MGGGIKQQVNDDDVAAILSLQQAIVSYRDEVRKIRAGLVRDVTYLSRSVGDQLRSLDNLVSWMEKEEVVP